MKKKRKGKISKLKKRNIKFKEQRKKNRKKRELLRFKLDQPKLISFFLALSWVLFFSIYDDHINEFRFAFLRNSIEFKMTQGTIVRSEITEVAEYTHHGTSLFAKDYRSNITYVYGVDKKRYLSDQLSSTSDKKFGALDKLAQYPKSKKIDVYYDANKPSFSSAIAPELRKNFFINYVGGAIWSLLCLILILYTHKRNKKIIKEKDNKHY